MLQYPVCPGHGAYIGMSPSGKAPDFDSGIRRFESCHPSQINDPLAQPVEQLPFKQWVRGSSPRRVTKKADTHLGICFFAPSGTRKMQCGAPVERRLPPAGRRQYHYFAEGKMQTSPQRVTTNQVGNSGGRAMLALTREFGSAYGSRAIPQSKIEDF